ncbi:GNAT family N-acetyltransferase [Roseibium sp.]|uniref:GNAT family N-acetyltransferase n=1 Tax=Roseibium sp. TaxID=1936156 RepID=UPI003266CBD9
MTQDDTLQFRWAAFDELERLDLHDLLKLRQDVFIVEQASLYADIDGKDPEALHCLVRSGQTGAFFGAIRLFVDPERTSARIGRVVIAQEARGCGLGRSMMQAGILKAEELAPDCEIHVTAQAHLEKFYGSLGFRRASETYLQDGIPHIDMIRP